MFQFTNIKKREEKRNLSTTLRAFNSKVSQTNKKKRGKKRSTIYFRICVILIGL